MIIYAVSSPDAILIRKLKEHWGWLSNMAPFRVHCLGQMWPSTEALFQALRFDPADPVRETIRRAPKPYAAKMLAHKNQNRMRVAPRSAQDLDNMRLVLWIKVAQHAHTLAPRLQSLVASGATPIIEDCTNRQTESGLFWGAALQPTRPHIWRGHNWLGRIWMEIRSELRTV